MKLDASHYLKDITKLKCQDIVQMEIGESKTFEYTDKSRWKYRSLVRRLNDEYGRYYLISCKQTGIVIKRVG